MLAASEGRYCAVIHDEKEQTLFAVRDHIGHEPFYYSAGEGFFAFSTSFKALRAMLGGSTSADAIGIADYLSLAHLDSERTLISEIKRLPPAHFLRINGAAEPEIRRYWSLRDCKPRELSSPDTCYQTFQQLLINIVGSETVSADKPGLMLSGGLDSSSIGAAYYQTARGKTHPLVTVGSGASNVLATENNEALENELQFMRAFVEKYPQTKFDVILDPEGSPLEVRRSIDEIGFPHRDFYFYVLRASVTHLVSQGADVVLTGIGGDFFASSKLPYFFSHQFIHGNFGSLIKQASSETGSPPSPGLYRFLASQIIRPLARLARQRLSEALGVHLDRSAPSSTDLGIRKEFARATNFDARIRKSMASAAPDFVFHTPQDIEADAVEDGAVAHILEYSAALSRALQVDIVNPLFDRRVIEFAATAPMSFRRLGKGGRSLLRNSFRDLLPDIIANRSTKGNFINSALAKFAPEAFESVEFEQLALPLKGYVDIAQLASVAKHAFQANRGAYDNIDKLVPLFAAMSLGHFLMRESPRT